MTDAQRVALGDTIAGTNQYKVLAAVLQNFEHATAATETALNSAGSAAQENAKYLESLEAREQSLKAEFEDFANRVLSKDVVAGFYDTAEAALQFINTDFGAATTRIIGTTTAVTSLVGILGTMGAKLVLVGKQLQSFGAAQGLLGLLTTPKTLLIIGGVVAAFVGLIEAAKGIQKAIDKANPSFEDANKNLQETQTEIQNTTTELEEYNKKLKELDEIDPKDRSSGWSAERVELETNIQTAQAYLEVLKQIEQAQTGKIEDSKYVTGYTGKNVDDYINGYIGTEASGQIKLTTAQMQALNAHYTTQQEAVMAISLALKDYITGWEDLEGLSPDEMTEELNKQLSALGVLIEKTTETVVESFSNMQTLVDKAAGGFSKLTKSEQEQAQKYLSDYQSLVKGLLANQNALTAAQKQEIQTYIDLQTTANGYAKESENLVDRIADVANSMGITATEAAQALIVTGELDSGNKRLVQGLVLLSNGLYAARDKCVQLEDGTWQLKDAIEETADSSDDLTGSLNAYQKSIKQVTDDEKAFVSSLFGINGNLTTAAQQALLADSAMADYANKILEAQQAQLKANFSTLILSLQQVGNVATLSAQSISQMMSLAGMPISGIDTEQGMARFKGWVRTQGYASVQDYIKAVGEKKYKQRLAELQKQSTSLTTYIPSVSTSSSSGGGSSSSTTSKKTSAQIAAEAATKAAKYKLDALQNELDALNDEKSMLEDEIQKIQDDVKAEYQAEIKVIENKKDAIQDAYEAWEENADAVLDRLKAEKSAIQAVIDDINKEKDQLEAATAYATEYASRQIDEIEERLTVLDAREAEINKKYDDELNNLKTTNQELDKQIEREKLLQNIASAKNKKKRVYSAKQGYILVEDIDAISKAQAELDKFDRQQKESLEEQEIENKRKQELLASGVEDERAALAAQKKLWEEYSKKWSSIVSEYEFKQNRLAYIQRYGKSIEQQNWQQRNNIVEQAATEYANIMAQIVAEQERLAAKESQIAAQEAVMNEAKIANQKATAALEKQISELQDEMVEAQEYRARRQMRTLEELAEAIEAAQRRVNQAQKDYDNANNYENSYDVEYPRVLKQINGKAPPDAKVGDFIATGGGIYHIYGGYTDNWQSNLISGTEGRYDLNDAYAAADWLVEHGYLKQGEFGYKSGTTSATPGLHLLGENGPELGVLSHGDGVIPASITKNLMDIGKNPEKFANTTVSQSGGDIIMQGVTLAFPNVRDGNDAKAFTKNFVNLAHQYAFKR